MGAGLSALGQTPREPAGTCEYCRRSGFVLVEQEGRERGREREREGALKFSLPLSISPSPPLNSLTLGLSVIAGMRGVVHGQLILVTDAKLGASPSYCVIRFWEIGVRYTFIQIYWYNSISSDELGNRL